MTSRQVELLVGLLVCLLAGLQAMVALLSWSHSPAVLMVVALLGSALVILGWFAWRTGHGRGWVVVLFLASFASTGLDGGGSTVLILILGVGLLGYTLGTAWGLLGLAVMVCLIELTTYASGNLGGWGVAGVQLLAVTLMLSLGVLLGQLLRELDQERRRNAELLDEVRRAAVTEQELMLVDERSRSARELHDGLGHQLTLVVLSLEFAERMRDKDPGRAFAEVQTARETAAEALAHMRRWVRALNLPREELVTGNAAFEAIARSFRGTGLDVRLPHRGRERELDRASSLFALRLVQEGLTNVVRHSSVTHVDLLVDWQPDALRLVLADDGGAVADLALGFGLRWSLAERAPTIGGSFEARGTQQGVEISGTIPTQEEK